MSRMFGLNPALAATNPTSSNKRKVSLPTPTSEDELPSSSKHIKVIDHPKLENETISVSDIERSNTDDEILVCQNDDQINIIEETSLQDNSTILTHENKTPSPPPSPPPSPYYDDELSIYIDKMVSLLRKEASERQNIYWDAFRNTIKFLQKDNKLKTKCRTSVSPSSSNLCGDESELEEKKQVTNLSNEVDLNPHYESAFESCSKRKNSPAISERRKSLRKNTIPPYTLPSKRKSLPHATKETYSTEGLNNCSKNKKQTLNRIVSKSNNTIKIVDVIINDEKQDLREIIKIKEEPSCDMDSQILAAATANTTIKNDDLRHRIRIKKEPRDMELEKLAATTATQNSNEDLRNRIKPKKEPCDIDLQNVASPSTTATNAELLSTTCHDNRMRPSSPPSYPYLDRVLNTEDFKGRETYKGQDVKKFVQAVDAERKLVIKETRQTGGSDSTNSNDKKVDAIPSRLLNFDERRFCAQRLVALRLVRFIGETEEEFDRAKGEGSDISISVRDLHVVQHSDSEAGPSQFSMKVPYPEPSVSSNGTSNSSNLTSESSNLTSETSNIRHPSNETAKLSSNSSNLTSDSSKLTPDSSKMTPYMFYATSGFSKVRSKITPDPPIPTTNMPCSAPPLILTPESSHNYGLPVKRPTTPNPFQCSISQVNLTPPGSSQTPYDLQERTNISSKSSQSDGDANASGKGPTSSAPAATSQTQPSYSPQAPPTTPCEPSPRAILSKLTMKGNIDWKKCYDQWLAEKLGRTFNDNNKDIDNNTANCDVQPQQDEVVIKTEPEDYDELFSSNNASTSETNPPNGVCSDNVSNNFSLDINSEEHAQNPNGAVEESVTVKSPAPIQSNSNNSEDVQSGSSGESTQLPQGGIFSPVSSFGHADMKKAFHKVSYGALTWMEKNHVWGSEQLSDEEQKLKTTLNRVKREIRNRNKKEQFEIVSETGKYLWKKEKASGKLHLEYKFWK